MDNPEKPATLGTQDATRRQAKQKTQRSTKLKGLNRIANVIVHI
jgi:hypothetical protein